MKHGHVRRFAPIEVLREDDLERIHHAALEVLESCGAQVLHEKALALLAEGGCLVDPRTAMARIPPGLAEECLRSTPSSYSLRARDPINDVQVGGDRVHFMQGMGMRHLEQDTGILRPATLREHAEVQIVGDALVNIHVMDALFSYTDLADVPPVMQTLEGLASGVRHSSKAQHFGYSKGIEVFAVEMARGLGMTLDCEIDIAPPIAFCGEAIDALYTFAELGWSVWATPGARAGATAPATLAGTVVESWAATVAFIVLAQLIRRGTPVSLCASIGVVNPKWMNPTQQPETWYVRAMMNQLARRFGIPITTACGFCGSAKRIDFQHGYEKALGVQFSVLSGSNLHVLHGSHCEELGFSNVLQVLDDDIAGSIGRLLEGTLVSDETLAVDLIREIGTSPATFMATALTREYWVKDRYVPTVANNEPHGQWVRGPREDLLRTAQQKVDEILATHEPAPLTTGQEELVCDVLADARNHFRGKGMISDDEWVRYQRVLGAAHAAQ